MRGVGGWGAAAAGMLGGEGGDAPSRTLTPPP